VFIEDYYTLMRRSKKTIDDHILTDYTGLNHSAAMQHIKKET